jgi:hypothetical protein
MTLKEKLELLLEKGNEDLSNVEFFYSYDPKITWDKYDMNYHDLIDGSIIIRIKEQK